MELSNDRTEDFAYCRDILAPVLMGAGAVCALASIQFIFVLEVPPTLAKFYIPALVGASGGLLGANWIRKLKNSSKALRASEAYYRDLFENANDLIQSVAPDGTFFYVNRAWRETLGYSEKEMAGLSVEDIIAPECTDHCLQTFKQMMDGRISDGHMHTTFVAKDGRRIAVEGNVNISFEKGEPVASRGFFRNIDARKKAQRALRISEERYRSLVENMNMGIILVDPDFRVVTANSAFGTLVGKEVGDIVGRNCCDIFPPGNPPCSDCPGKRALASGKTETAEFDAEFIDGRAVSVRIQAFPTFTEGGEVAGFIEVAEDITERKKAEEAIRRSNEFSRTVLNSMNDAVAILDTDDFTIVDVNQVFLDECGRQRQDVIGEPCYQVTHLLDTPCVGSDHACPLGETLASGRHFAVEHVHYDSEGKVMQVEVSTSPIFDGQGAVKQVVHVSRDISERKRAEKEIHELAYYDTLTGLPNRLLLQDRLSKALEQAFRRREKVAILFLDLDRFKAINDTLGHAAGDLLLSAVAERLKKVVRKSDTIARLGGDEFVLVLPAVAEESTVSRLAQDVIESLSQPISLGENEVFSTVSIGIALYPTDGRDEVALLKNADSAMYSAKESGRACYQFYSREMNLKALERLSLETSLRRALQQNEFYLAYQPQFDLRNDHIVGVEALLRWHHPKKGLISPAAFIPLAEETGLILPIGEWVLRTACAQIKALQEQGWAGLTVAVNLSGRQLKQPNFIDVVDAALEDSGLDPCCLELEMTESILMDQAEDTIQALIDLKVRGIKLSLDDFGTGYSSLSYLKNFPFDRIKVAQEFVRNIPYDQDGAAIVEAIIAMSGSLGLRLIAEGVETSEQLEFLLERKCYEVQGYHFAKPMPIESLRDCFEEGLAADGVCMYKCG